MIIENTKAYWKRIISYTKKNWDLKDYPIRYRKQKGVPVQYNVGDLKLWSVQIINWWTMNGLGDTKEEAYEMLKNNFNNYRQENAVPRPGCEVPLRFADNSKIQAIESIAVDFFEKTLDLDYYECFISDESSLIDFGIDEKETLDKINLIYNLELTELGDGNIARILKLIDEKNGSTL